MRLGVVQRRFVWIQLWSILYCAYSKTEVQDHCQNVEIVSREEWLARPPWRHQMMKMPVNHVVIQHTVTSPCLTKEQCIREMQFIQDYHMDDNGWGDIGYNFLVGGDGRIYEAIGWDEPGAHSINYNHDALGIAFVGNYMEVEPSEKMLNATLNLLDCGVRKGFLTPTREIHGHRDVTCTLSPGDKLYAIIRQWKYYKGGRMPKFNCQK